MSATDGAAQLRQAAETLRTRAEAVTRHCKGADLWFDADADLRNAIRGTFLGNQDSAPDDARWIATMPPTIGLALAKWLDDVAAGWAWDDTDEVRDHDGDPITLGWSIDSHPLALARLINTGAEEA